MTPDHRLTVLLVEDSPGDAALVREALRPSSAEIVHVERRTTAEQVLDDDPRIDVVLLDLGLPDGDGLALVERLVGHPADVPVVVLTGRDDHDLADEAVAAGAQDYLIKGASPEAMLDRTLRNAIERARLAEDRDRALRHQQLLTAVGRVGLSDRELPSRLEAIAGQVADTLGLETVLVVRARPAAGLEVLAAVGADAGPVDVDRFVETVGGPLVRDGSRLVMAAGGVGGSGGTAKGTVVGVPLPGASRPAGCLLLAGGRLPTREEFDVLDSVAVTVAEVVRRADSEHDLRERIKELDALRAIAHAAERTDELDVLLRDVADALVVAVQWPESAGVCVHVDAVTATAGVSDVRTAVEAPVVVRDRVRGRVRVGYAGRGSFLAEEQALLDVVAEALATWLARHDAAEDAATSRARLAALFEHSLDAMILYQAGGRIVEANPAACALTGRPVQDLRSMHVQDLLSDADRERVPDIQRALAEAGRWEGDGTLVRGDGTEVLAESRHVADVLPGLNLVSARDVTAVRRARDELTRREERFRSLVQNAPDLVAVLDRDGIVTYCSPAAERILGRSRGELVGRDFREFVPATARGDAGDLWEQVVATDGTTGPLLHPLMHADGSIRWVEVIHTNHLDDPAIGGIVSNIRDVTERVVGERALRDSERRLRTVVEHVGEGLFLLSPDGTIVDANATARAMMGMRHEAIVGRRHDDPDAEIVNPATGRAAIVLPVDEVLRTGETLRDVELDVLAGDSRRTLAFNVAPLTSGADRVTGAVATFRDVTAQHEARERLRVALEREKAVAARLRQVDRMKNDFLTAVSHEVRTPLTSVLGFSQVLAEHDLDLPPDRRRELLERLRVNAARLQTLLDDLLDIDRLERGALELRARTTDITRIVAGVLEQMDGTGRVRLHGQSVCAPVEVPRLERIVEALVSNALRHSPDGSPVDVTVRTSGDDLEVLVEDRGPGIPPGDRERIFSAFELGDSPAARVGGAGIGLTIARSLAGLHGGDVRIEDRDGGGSRFVVRLPGACDDREPAPEGPAGHGLPGRPTAMP